MIFTFDAKKIFTRFESKNINDTALFHPYVSFFLDLGIRFMLQSIMV